MDGETKNKKNIIYPICTFFLTLIAVLSAGYLYGLDKRLMVRNGVLIAVLLLCVLFTVSYEALCGRFLFDNDAHPARFYLAYFIFLTEALFFPLLPESGWIFLAVFVTLTLFSSPLTAFMAGMLLLCISLLLSGSTDISIFLAYIIPGGVAVAFFSSIGEDFKVFVPVLLSILSQLLTLSVYEVIVTDKVFSILLFIYPVLNIMVCIVIMLIVLKIFSFLLVYKEEDRFMDIIDPEFELLTMLKGSSKEDYDHCVYTAVLCAKMANALSLSEALTKALGYYHRIGIIRGEANWENTRELLEEYEIPANVTELLSEYLDKNRYIKSKETGVLLFADTVISSIEYLFSKDKNAQLNYDKLIGTIFDKKLESGVLNHSDVSFEDINIMKKTLIDEKLFYDFLR